MTNPTPPPPPPKKHGCFFYGCIISLVIFLIVALGGFLTVRYIANRLHEMVAQYTDTAPANLPAEQMPAQELKELHDRLAAFDSAMKAHSNAPPLVLTSQDINALIAENPQLKGKCYVTLDGDKIKGQISLPLNTLKGMPGYDTLHLDGRYLNGGGTFRASINDGDLSVFVESLEANGKPLPENFMTAFRAQNLAQGFNQSQKQNQGPKPFENYESLEVKDSTIIVKAKAQ
jgi:hypothetical protein